MIPRYLPWACGVMRPPRCKAFSLDEPGRHAGGKRRGKDDHSNFWIAASSRRAKTLGRLN